MLPAPVVTIIATINPRVINLRMVSSRIVSPRIIGMLLVTGTLMTALTGCGQKGDLYLADSNSQMVTGSSEALDSTSNPQDAAFAGLDDAEYEQSRDLEQKQLLPGATDDPNDY